MLRPARAVLGTSGMNPALFSLKRAHQATLRLTRYVTEPFGLTPARYDMMCAVKRWQTYGMPQKVLVHTLGVTGATVSRMLDSLEKLGVVRRQRCAYDRRRNDVWLTELGLRVLEAVLKLIVRPGWMHFALAWTMGTMGPRDLLPPRYCYRELALLAPHLVKIRIGFCDTGCLGYPS